MKKFIIILIISVLGALPAALAQSVDPQALEGPVNAEGQTQAQAQATAETFGPEGTPSRTSVTSGFVPLAPIPGLTQDATADTAGLANFFNNLYKYLIGLAAVLAVIMIIWGGLEYSTQDSVSKKSDGKNRIIQAILGLVLVLSPALVFSIINPSILNLSINFTKLDTASGFPGSGGAGTSGTGAQPTTAVDPATLCSVTGVSGILQIATCPSSTAATTWGQNCSGNLSRISLTNPNNGIITNVALCAGTQQYVFINNTDAWVAFTINRLQPLVSTADRPSNGSDAMRFTNICSGANLSLKTCVSDRPALTFQTPCGLSPERAWKCYKETLSCESGTVAAVSDKCSGSPSWTPFQ